MQAFAVHLWLGQAPSSEVQCNIKSKISNSRVYRYCCENTSFAQDFLATFDILFLAAMKYTAAILFVLSSQLSGVAGAITACPTAETAYTGASGANC
jgi:hypothetical protein